MAKMAVKLRVALDTLGCQLNQAETEAMARSLNHRGYRLVEQGADVYILNTCTVTQMADAKARQGLKAAQRYHPGAFVIATGCYAQRAPEALAAIPGVNLVLTNESKSHLIEHIEQRFPGGAALHQASPGLRTRSRIKIQEGCNSQCSYCIVPQVRGEERSYELEAIIAEVKQRETEGCQEMVLTGTNIGSYHRHGFDLKGLVEEILARTAIPRIRLSSLQPQHLTPSLLSLWQNSRLCPHFHLPLQSGSDRLLRAMGRPYTSQAYRLAVRLLKDTVPQVAITTDVIVGFPGEEEADFEGTLALCQELGLARLHVFPFSPRPGTPAARWPSVPQETKEERRQRLLSLARAVALDFPGQFLGQEFSVLCESETAPGIWRGLTPNYLRVLTASPQSLAHRITRVRLSSLVHDGVWGEMT